MLGLLLLPIIETAVRAKDYGAFQLWGGAALQPVLTWAETLYILQGQINQSRRYPSGDVRLIVQDISVSHLAQDEVQVVYRAHTLRWTLQIYQAMLNQVQHQKRADNPVVDIQIDFDTCIRYLDEYVDFLHDLHRCLLREYRLNITGLLDQGSNAEPAAVNRLKGVVSEMVVQIYQGRHSISNHVAYPPRASRLQLPYRIGLVQDGDWQIPDYLEESPRFRGYVVLLLNPQWAQPQAPLPAHLPLHSTCGWRVSRSDQRSRISSA